MNKLVFSLPEDFSFSRNWRKNTAKIPRKPPETPPRTTINLRLGFSRFSGATAGSITSIYTDFDGDHLCGPNDIVFDRTGGFWFTDLGKQRRREIDRGAVYYAQPDGSSIQRMLDNVDHANGCGLSPDGNTLYVAQTTTGRL